jgi:protein SCO1
MVRFRIAANFLLSLLCVILLIGCGATQGSADPKQQFSSVGTVIDPPLPVSDFTLTDQHGKPTSLHDLHGKVTLVYLGYTNCTDICPTTMANFTRIKQALGADAEKAAFVFITIDPAHDTPEVLAQYLGVFDPSFIGLSGDLPAIQKAAQAFQTSFLPQPDGKTIDHTERIYLLNKEASIRISYLRDALPAAIASDMKLLMAE